jgi:ATP-dependent Zn protease
MKQYKVTFTDFIEADSEEQAYDKLLEYLKDICKYEDVTAFDFSEEL